MDADVTRIEYGIVGRTPVVGDFGGGLWSYLLSSMSRWYRMGFGVSIFSKSTRGATVALTRDFHASVLCVAGRVPLG